MKITKAKIEALIGWSVLSVGLAACSPPAPISAEATQAIIKNCERQGMGTRIFNSGAVSIVECVETKVVATGG